MKHVGAKTGCEQDVAITFSQSVRQASFSRSDMVFTMEITAREVGNDTTATASASPSMCTTRRVKGQTVKNSNETVVTVTLTPAEPDGDSRLSKAAVFVESDGKTTQKTLTERSARCFFCGFFFNTGWGGVVTGVHIRVFVG